LYKRVSGAKSRSELRDLQVELIDRFGLLPDAATNYMHIAAIKLAAIKLGIEKIDASVGGGYLIFSKQTRVDPNELVNLMQNEGQIYRMQGAHRLQFRLDLTDPALRFTKVEQLLDQLTPKDVENKAMAG
jgi:transcription-repair coupling factor (superfamily II helicase)